MTFRGTYYWLIVWPLSKLYFHVAFVPLCIKRKTYRERARGGRQKGSGGEVQRSEENHRRKGKTGSRKRKGSRDEGKRTEETGRGMKRRGAKGNRLVIKEKEKKGVGKEGKIREWKRSVGCFSIFWVFSQSRGACQPATK